MNSTEQPGDDALERFLENFSVENDDALKSFLDGFADTVGEYVDWQSNSANAELVAEGERHCPICSETMATIRDYDTRVDACAEHGTWLDSDELEAILENYRNSAVSEFRSRSDFDRGVRDGRRWRTFSGVSAANYLRCAASNEEQRQTELQCPICDATMAHASKFGVQLEVCREHGIWLDVGEVGRVIEGFKVSPEYLTERMQNYMRGYREGARSRGAG